MKDLIIINNNNQFKQQKIYYFMDQDQSLLGQDKLSNSNCNSQTGLCQLSKSQAKLQQSSQNNSIFEFQCWEKQQHTSNYSRQIQFNRQSQSQQKLNLQPSKPFIINNSDLKNSIFPQQLLQSKQKVPKKYNLINENSIERLKYKTNLIKSNQIFSIPYKFPQTTNQTQLNYLQGQEQKSNTQRSLILSQPYKQSILLGHSLHNNKINSVILSIQNPQQPSLSSIQSFSLSQQFSIQHNSNIQQSEQRSTQLSQNQEQMHAYPSQRIEMLYRQYILKKQYFDQSSILKLSRISTGKLMQQINYQPQQEMLENFLKDNNLLDNSCDFNEKIQWSKQCSISQILQQQSSQRINQHQESILKMSNTQITSQTRMEQKQIPNSLKIMCQLIIFQFQKFQEDQLILSKNTLKHVFYRYKDQKLNRQLQSNLLWLFLNIIQTNKCRKIQQQYQQKQVGSIEYYFKIIFSYVQIIFLRQISYCRQISTQYYIFQKKFSMISQQELQNTENQYTNIIFDNLIDLRNKAFALLRQGMSSFISSNRKYLKNQRQYVFMDMFFTLKVAERQVQDRAYYLGKIRQNKQIRDHQNSLLGYMQTLTNLQLQDQKISSEYFRVRKYKQFKLGQFYFNRCQIQLALSYYQESVKITTGQQNKSQISNQLINMAKICKEIELYDKVVDFYKRIFMALYYDNNNDSWKPLQQIKNLVYIALVNHAKKSYRKAVLIYEKCLQILDIIDDKNKYQYQYQASINFRISNSYQKLNNIQQRIYHLRKSYEISAIHLGSKHLLTKHLIRQLNELNLSQNNKIQNDNLQKIHIKT